MIVMQACNNLLYDLLLQRGELRGCKELRQGYLQPVTDHLDGYDLWILALAIQDIFDTGRGQGRERCQFIDADASLPSLTDRVYLPLCRNSVTALTVLRKE